MYTHIHKAMLHQSDLAVEQFAVRHGDFISNVFDGQTARWLAGDVIL